MDSTFNKKRPIKHIVKMNIFYKEYRKKAEINVIRGQKQNVILDILWLVYYNSEINWKIREVRMMKCPKKCRRQWKAVQKKPGLKK